MGADWVSTGVTDALMLHHITLDVSRVNMKRADSDDIYEWGKTLPRAPQWRRLHCATTGRMAQRVFEGEGDEKTGRERRTVHTGQTVVRG